METSPEAGDIEHIDIEDCVESCSGVKLDILKLIVIYFVYSAIYKEVDYAVIQSKLLFITSVLL